MFIIFFVYLEKESKFLIFRKQREFYVFFSFLGRQGDVPRSCISSGAMRKLDLHNSFGRKQFVLGRFYFIIFLKDFGFVVNCELKQVEDPT